MEQPNEDYIEIDLFQLLRTLWKHAALILLSALLCGAAGFGLAYKVIPPKYQASALLYVNNSSISVGSTSISLSDLSASQTLVDTYIAILKTRLTLDEVAVQAGLDYEYEELEEMIEAEAVNHTEIFEVKVTSRDPVEAERIANTVVAVLPDKISQIVDGASVRTVDYAVVPEKRHSPSITMFTILGVLAGMLASCGAVALHELLDDQIHGEDDLLQICHLPVLAAVPDLLAQESKGYSSYYAQAEGTKR